jgi:hypothetical protein
MNTPRAAPKLTSIINYLNFLHSHSTQKHPARLFNLACPASVKWPLPKTFELFIPLQCFVLRVTRDWTEVIRQDVAGLGSGTPTTRLLQLLLYLRPARVLSSSSFRWEILRCERFVQVKGEAEGAKTLLFRSSKGEMVPWHERKLLCVLVFLLYICNPVPSGGVSYVLEIAGYFRKTAFRTSIPLLMTRST